ncbi:MAG: sulfatase-like hydrolase/transferase [Planctomycetota bacterium]|jgi:arylsulfatase
MEKNHKREISRRDFIKATCSVTLAMGAAGGLVGPVAAQAQNKTGHSSSGPYNILMIVTDQERHLRQSELPIGFNPRGHERLAERGVVFENHQIASCVCTPSRAVIYTGQHIQNNGMFDNTNFPWSNDLSTDIDTIGDMLRKEGYYAAYKGKWHLNDEFETTNDLHAPKKLLVDEMEEYGFSDYFGIGDIIAHTEGGYLHDDVITAMSRNWLRSRGEQLRQENKPWFLAVNITNPHDVMYYNTDLPGQAEQSAGAMFHLNREPNHPIYHVQWDAILPKSRNQSLQEPGRPAAHYDYIQSRGAMVGIVPNEDSRWQRLNNYYLNCLRDADRHLVEILDELENLGISDKTIVIYTADHGELCGAHGISGKGATGYREQNNVPFIISHPAYKGGKRCKAVTSHVDIAPTLVSIARGKSSEVKGLCGKDITALLENPEKASFDALRPGALYNFNMFAYIDSEFLPRVAKFFAEGGNPEDLANQGFRPNLKKRGAIRSIYDGRYKFNRYYSPTEHHTPRTIEELFANNDVELFDVKNDPLEMKNLAVDSNRYGDILLAMNDKLNLLIEQEVGEDIGQMLPGGADANWRLGPEIRHLRM